MGTILICPHCGVEFMRGTNAQVYCSVKCRRAANKKPKPKKIEKYKCDWCGEEFLSERRKKYCSKECRLFVNGRLKKREVQSKPSLSIEEVAVLSREAGMSYGEYVQKHNL